MAIFFIQESKEKNKFKLKINNMFNRIEYKENFISLPINEKIKLSSKKVKKIIRKLKENNIRTVVLSKYLDNIQELKNEIYSNNINILEGRYLFKLLIKESIEYICKKSNKKMEDLEISFLTNDANNLNKQIILELSQEVKRLNIITNHIEEFQDIEDYLYNEMGIMIKLSNNKKTDLLKTNIIINMDFMEDIINKYNLPKQGIIININGGIKIKSKKFNGINTNSYTAKISNKYKIEGFNDECVYESYIWGKEYDLARKQILDDKIRIKNLIGEKGIINSREFDKL